MGNTLILRLLAALSVVAITSRGLAQAPATAPANPAIVIALLGEIDDYSRDMLFRRFEQARADGATNIILQIDTYGGSAKAGLEISGFIKRQNNLHTVAFIHEKAYSAGAMIALACDEIVMQPGSVSGDC